MADAVGKRIAGALEAALKDATTASGARTDIGRRVLVNRPGVQNDEMPAVVIRLGEATLDSQPQVECQIKGQWTRDIVIEAAAKTAGDPLVAEDMLDDIAAAVYRAWTTTLEADRPVKQLRITSADTSPRDEGNDAVSAFINLEARYLTRLGTLE